MPKKSLSRRQKIRTFLVIKQQKKYFFFKKILKNYKYFQNNMTSHLLHKNKMRMYFLQKKMQKLPKNSIAVRLRNQCMYTGRSRGFNKEWAISRMIFRLLVSQGSLTGVLKSSW